jgi:LacI family transcriptional regulator
MTGSRQCRIPLRMAVRENIGRRRRSGVVTLQHVAEKAGVSTATVSRFLNDPPLVSDGIKERVEAAILALGYIPHRAARALASNRSQTVGAVVPTLDNAIFSRHITAFQQRLARSGYTLLLATSEYEAQTEFQQARVLLEHGVDALMLVGERRSEEFYALLERARVPFITTWVYRPDSPHPCCGFDHELALKQSVDHLVELGHERFGVVTGLAERNDRVAARLTGIHKALGAHGLALDERLVFGCGYSYEAGREGLRRLLAVDPALTAIIAGNDVLASGVLFEARAQRIGVPERLSVVGFGDLEIAKQTDPALTTVHTPKEEIGNAAAAYLLERLMGLNPPERIELDTWLCIRQSTGPAAVSGHPKAIST